MIRDAHHSAAVRRHAADPRSSPSRSAPRAGASGAAAGRRRPAGGASARKGVRPRSRAARSGSAAANATASSRCHPARRDGGVPLLVFLHGATQNGAQHAAPRSAGAADALGIAVLAPDSRQRTWDAISGRFGEDVAFLNRDAGACLHAAGGRSGAPGHRRILRRRLVRALARPRQRRSVSEGRRLLAGIRDERAAPGTATRLRVARHGGSDSPDRPMQPRHRPAAARRWAMTSPTASSRGGTRCRPTC